MEKFVAALQTPYSEAWVDPSTVSVPVGALPSQSSHAYFLGQQQMQTTSALSVETFINHEKAG
jgi:hypothetical protein